MSARSACGLAVPVLAESCAAVLLLRSMPAGGSDVALELVCVLADAAMGMVGPGRRLAPGCRRPVAGPRGLAGGEHVGRRRGCPYRLFPRHKRPITHREH